LSQMSINDSSDLPNEVFPKVAKHLLACQVQDLLEQVTANQLTLDTVSSRLHLHSRQALDFCHRMLYFLFSERMVLNEEVEREAASFFKMYLLKTQYQHFGQLFRGLCLHSSKHLDKSLDNQPLVSKLISFMSALFNSSSGQRPERLIALKGAGQGLHAQMEPDAEGPLLSFSRDFTLVMCFKVDSLPLTKPDSTLTLLSFHNQSTDQGLTLRVEDNVLWLRYVLPVKGPEMVNEFPVFEDVSSMICSGWNSFFLENQFNRKSKTSNLKFQFNKKAFLTTKGFEDAYFVTAQQVLSVLSGGAAELSLVCVLSEAVNADKMEAVNGLLLQGGVTSAEAVERFLQSVGPHVGSGQVGLLVHPFCQLVSLPGQAVLVDWTQRVRFEVGPEVVVRDSSANRHKHSVASNGVATTLLCLLNFAHSEDDLSLLIRHLRDVATSLDLTQFQADHGMSLFAAIGTGLVAVRKTTLVDSRCVDSLVHLLKEQDKRHLRRCWKDLLLDYNFVDRVLHSEALVTGCFEELLRFVSNHQPAVFDIDFNQLLTNVLLFVSQTPSSLTSAKALFCLRLVATGMRTQAVARVVDVVPLLRYFARPQTGQPMINSSLLKVLKLSVKVKGVAEEERQLLVDSLSAFVLRCDDGILLSKAIGLLRSSALVDEKALVGTWRSKFSEADAVADTRLALLNCWLQRRLLRNSEVLVRLLVRKSFVAVDTGREFEGNDSMALEKQGLFSLLLEVSLAAGEEVLGQVVQAVCRCLASDGNAFAVHAANTNLLSWAVLSAFALSTSPQGRDHLPLAVQLIASFCTQYHKASDSCEHLDVLSQALTYYSAETKNDRLGLEVALAVLDSLNKAQVIFGNAVSLNLFVIFGFRTVFGLMAGHPKDDLFTRALTALMASWHRTINLNPLPDVPSFLLEPWPPQSQAKSSRTLFSSLTNSSLSQPSASASNDCALRCIVLVLFRLVEDCLSTPSPKASLSPLFEFINAFVYRFNYHLDSRRDRIRADRLQVAESHLYFLLAYLFQRPAVFGWLREVLDGLLFFALKSKTGEDLCSKFCRELRVVRPEQAQQLMQRLKMDMAPQQVYLAELISLDLGGDHGGLVAELMGQVGSYCGALRTASWETAVEAHGQLSGQSQTVRDDIQSRRVIGHLVAKAFLKLAVRLRHFKRLYRSEFQEHGRLVSQTLLEQTRLKPQFDPKHFEYDPLLHDVVEYRHSKFVCANFQSPFVRKRVKSEQATLRLPTPPPLPADFKLDDYFEHRCNAHFRCQRVNGLTVVPSVLEVDEHKKALRVVVDFEGKTKSTVEAVGVELKRHQFRLGQTAVTRVEAGELWEVIPSKFMQQRKSLILLLRDFSHLVLVFASTEDCQRANAALTRLAGKESAFWLSGFGKHTLVQRSLDKWLSFKRSNFAYLMVVNLFSGRSVHDYSQYPVFPLLVKRYDSVIVLRELDKPVGMNKDDRLMATYQQTFISSSRDDPARGYFYGSFYSFPTQVFNLLVRKRPEAEGSRIIHNGAFDVPDRVFASVAVMLRNIAEDASDVQEWIPELFSLPEVFLNLNNFDFKTGSTGHRVHNVSLPESCKHSPYKLVATLSQLLESPLVSMKLGAWIDLVFGVRQSGAKAMESRNVFYPATYEHRPTDTEAMSAQDTHAFCNQSFHFGTVPVQLFTKPHCNKKITGEQQTVASADSKTKYFLRYRDVDQGPNRVLFVKKTKEKGMLEYAGTTKRLVVVKQTSLEVWRFKTTVSAKNNLNPYEMVLEQSFSLERTRSSFWVEGGVPKMEGVVEVLGEQRLLLGGYLSGKVCVVSYKNDWLVAKQRLHDCTVTALLVSKEGQLVSADCSSIVKVSTLDSKSHWTVLRTLVGFFSNPVLTISRCKQDKRLHCFNSKESIEVFHLGAARGSERLFRVDKSRLHFLPNDVPVDEMHSQAFVSIGNVNCVVFYAFYNGKNHLFAFSLLGQVIGFYSFDAKQDNLLVSFDVIADEAFKWFLIAVDQRGDVFLFDLPFFEVGRKINSNQSNRAKHLSMFLNNKLAMVVDEKGYVDILTTLVKPFE
jgi:hypothetical protein